MQTWIVEETNEISRLDKYCASYLGKPRNLILQLIKIENILVNDQVKKPNYTVKTNDQISVVELDRPNIEVEAHQVDLDIFYEDDDLIIINKSSNMVVHPGAGNYTNTVVNGLMYLSKKLSSINGEYRPGVVHRIDKDTTGLILFAKNDQAHNKIGAQLKDKSSTRKYIALVHGVIDEDELVIDAPIGRDQNDRTAMTVTEKNSKDAITNVKILKRFAKYTLVECQLTTGRTHQIRVHMQYIKHQVVGDPKYGLRKTIDCDGQALHAKTLGFIHPKTNKYVEFTSELPVKMQNMINELEELDE